MRGIRRLITLLAVAFLLYGDKGAAQDLASFEKRVTTKTLENGLTVIVCERPEAPVFSFFTHVNAGAVQEEMGQTGLAHMFEHMAFKGTDTIGTTDYAEEKVALAKVEEAFLAFDAERRKPEGRDEKKAAELDKTWKNAIAEADRYVVIERIRPRSSSGPAASGINAFTTGTRPATSSRCRRTASSSGLISSRSGSSTPSCASSTRSATSSRRSAACAPRVEPDRTARRAVPGDRLHRPSVRTARRRVAVRPASASRRPTPRRSSSGTTSRRTWSSRSSAT